MSSVDITTGTILLVSRHTPRRYSVSGRVLATISFVKHSAALTILSRHLINILNVFTKNTCYKPPEEKNSGVESREEGSQGMGEQCPVRTRGGAPPHISLRVCTFLDMEFPDRRIGRGGGRHTRVPSFSSFDSPGGSVKDAVYSEKVQNANELHDRIVRAADRYQRNAFQDLARNWISSWCTSCH
jgi:hypothetical protein